MMQQLLTLFQNISILLFGYFIPALSSVKAVVHKDIEAYHQWSTYWLILHLYTTILSPILHLTLHPLFQLLAIFWLVLPKYQGAGVVYDRVVVPWVNKYEVKVDDTIDVAHRGARRWVLAKLKTILWAVMGEGGSLVDVLIQGVIGSTIIAENESKVTETENKNDSTSASNPPRHSVKEALSSSSSIAEMSLNEDQSFDDNLVQDFMSMLVHGLYVFANVEKIASEHEFSIFEGGFKLGVFSFEEGKKRFNITPAGRDKPEEQFIERVYVNDLTRLDAFGPQSLLLECSTATGELIIRAEIVLSDENDRNILLNGLRQCLPTLKGIK
ncbi:hypothetical protein ACHAWT_001180 [Skeletonema menzelii]